MKQNHPFSAAILLLSGSVLWATSTARARAAEPDRLPSLTERFLSPRDPIISTIAQDPGTWRPLLDRAKLPRIRFHDLRHTAATLALQAGTHPVVVQRQLGHSSIALTIDTYSHSVPSLGREAADRLDALLREG